MFKANINNSSQRELLSCCFCDHVSPNISTMWLLLCNLRVSFQLASPPGFHVTHISKGNLAYIDMYRFASCEYMLGERARPSKELICLFWMRRRDMAILFDSGVGSSTSDSVRLLSVLQCCRAGRILAGD